MTETVVTPNGYMLVKDVNEDGVKTSKLYDDKNRLVEYNDSIGNHYIYRFDNGDDVPVEFKNVNESDVWVEYEFDELFES